MTDITSRVTRRNKRLGLRIEVVSAIPTPPHYTARIMNKYNLTAIACMVMALATACGAFANFSHGVIAIMAIVTGLLGLLAGWRRNNE